MKGKNMTSVNIIYTYNENEQYYNVFGTDRDDMTKLLRSTIKASQSEEGADIGKILHEGVVSKEITGPMLMELAASGLIHKLDKARESQSEALSKAALSSLLGFLAKELATSDELDEDSDNEG